MGRVVAKCKNQGRFAFGTWNSIPDYVPADSYLNMIEIVREYRGAKSRALTAVSQRSFRIGMQIKMLNSRTCV